MRKAFALLAVFASLAFTVPAVAGPKVFKETSDYRKDSELKGYLNLRYDTYAQMFAEPKGTDVDWAFKSADFNLAEIRKAGVTYYAGGLSTGTNGNPYLDFALMGSFYGNGLAAAFESQVMSLGIQVTRPNAPKAGDDPTRADQAKLASLKAKLDADLAGMDLEMEKALFDEDKTKLGVSEAVKNSNARKTERNAKIQAQVSELEAKIAKTKPASANPEDQPGFSLVLYLMESGVNAGSYFSPVATNSTTAEFILLKDGKPVLAGRHCAVSAMFGSSTSKCGQKLATAFNIKN